MAKSFMYSHKADSSRRNDVHLLIKSLHYISCHSETGIALCSQRRGDMSSFKLISVAKRVSGFDKSLCFDYKQNIQVFCLYICLQSSVTLLSLSCLYLKYSFWLTLCFYSWGQKDTCQFFLMALLAVLQILSCPFFF